MRCLALFSGGLDSMLAIKIMHEQGIEVLALHIDIGFGGKGDKGEILRRRAQMAGASFKIIDIKDAYLQDVLFSPKHGYGKHFNPCIDCHGYMFKTALLLLEKENASFVITGEVLGQRPMSQRNQAMKAVKELSGDDEELILRPLCAKLLTPTKPEILGWVDREKLFNISGRSRTRQLELAREFGFEDFESPAGGCLLTIQSFSQRLKDSMKFEKIESSKDSEILKFGRHLRLKDGAKMIIGRDENDNERLQKIENPKFLQIKFKDEIIGAFSLLSKNASANDKVLAAKLALTYAKTDVLTSYEVQIESEIYTLCPFGSKDAAKPYFI